MTRLSLALPAAALVAAALAAPAQAFSVPVDLPHLTWPTEAASSTTVTATTTTAPDTATKSCIDLSRLSQPLDSCQTGTSR